MSGNGPEIPFGIYASLKGFAVRRCKMRQKQSHRPDQSFNFHGLADAFGLESLLDFYQQQIFPLLLRAHVYRHRHCVYFEACTDKDVIKKIRLLMNRQSCDEALKVIKEKASIIYIPQEFLDSWELIPDQRLDPFKNYIPRIA